MANALFIVPIPPKSGPVEAPAPEPIPPSAQNPAPTPPNIQEWAEKELNFFPDKNQLTLMTDTSGRVLFCGARQIGKSSATAVRVLYEAVHYDESLIILAAPTLRQAVQILGRAKNFALKIYKQVQKSTQADTGFRLPNGSEIVAIPDMPDHVRGFPSPRLIVVDEAAFVSDPLFAALFCGQGVSNGARILLSSPNGQAGYFYEQWTDETQNWRRIKVTADQCDRLNPEFLKQIKFELGDRRYRQEFNCEFMATGQEVISREVFRKSLRSTVRSLFPEDQK